MSSAEMDKIAQINTLCRTAREEVGDTCSFRLRVLLDMILIELERLDRTCAVQSADFRKPDIPSVR